jgi:protein gp37
MTKTKIEWTQSTWNPVTGCSKISPGCFNCYAERLAKRLKAMGNPSYINGFEVTLHENMLDWPLKISKPTMIFVNSMSDLFHEDVPLDFIQKVFHSMRLAKQHVFQILTKRSQRLLELNNEINWPNNVWMGVSVENSDYKFRIDDLRQTNAKIKFLSIEPLIGPLGRFSLLNIDWVIVGGESGPKSRLMQKEWVLEIRDQCKPPVAFFFKQWGGFNKKLNGRELEGKIWDDMPKKLAYT